MHGLLKYLQVSMQYVMEKQIMFTDAEMEFGMQCSVLTGFCFVHFDLMSLKKDINMSSSRYWLNIRRANGLSCLQVATILDERKFLNQPEELGYLAQDTPLLLWLQYMRCHYDSNELSRMTMCQLWDKLSTVKENLVFSNVKHFKMLTFFFVHAPTM